MWFKTTAEDGERERELTLARVSKHYASKQKVFKTAKSFTYLNSALSPKSASVAVTVVTRWPIGTDLLSRADIID